MMFKHNLIQSNEYLEREEIDGRRFYITPSNNLLPSVTTVLKDYNQEDFSEWENRVGKYKAAAIRLKAMSRGRRFHELCEKYLLNEDNHLNDAMPDVIEDFVNTKDVLDSNVNTIYGVELRMFSEELGMAGTTDLVCEWGSIRSVVDFKTSKKEKKEAWLENYFLQESIYATIITEKYGIDIPQIITIMVVSGERPKIFSRKVEDYKEKIDEISKFARTFPAYQHLDYTGYCSGA